MSTKTARILFCLLVLWLAQPSTLRACSTAVFGPAATADGAPLLWKNRDTDVLSNKVVFVPEKPFSYLGLVNAEETSGRSVYAGLNAEGFAIFNSVAYQPARTAHGDEGSGRPDHGRRPQDLPHGGRLRDLSAEEPRQVAGQPGQLRRAGRRGPRRAVRGP